MTFYATNFCNNESPSDYELEQVRKSYRDKVRKFKELATKNFTEQFPEKPVPNFEYQETWEQHLESVYSRLFGLAVYHAKRDGQLAVIKEMRGRNIDGIVEKYIDEKVKDW